MTIEEWPEIILYCCGHRMLIYRTMPVERDDDGLCWRHRYWRCSAPGCSNKDQTRDEVHESEISSAEEKPKPEIQPKRPAQRGGSGAAQRVQELRNRRR